MNLSLLSRNDYQLILYKNAMKYNLIEYIDKKNRSKGFIDLEPIIYKSDVHTETKIKKMIKPINNYITNLIKYKPYENKKEEDTECIHLFIYTFYYLFLKLDRIPMLEEFINEYMLNFDKTLANLVTDKLSREEDIICKTYGIKYHSRSIIKRAVIAYASILRDLHFYHLASESGLFPYVKYKLQSDAKGVDCIVKHNDVPFGVHLYVNSKKARRELKRKEQEKHKWKNKHIYLKIEMDREHKVGQIYLYNHSDLITLKNMMDEELS